MGCIVGTDCAVGVAAVSAQGRAGALRWKCSQAPRMGQGQAISSTPRDPVSRPGAQSGETVNRIHHGFDRSEPYWV